MLGERQQMEPQTATQFMAIWASFVHQVNRAILRKQKDTSASFPSLLPLNDNFLPNSTISTFVTPHSPQHGTEFSYPSLPFI
jgi:hypothetical protein